MSRRGSVLWSLHLGAVVVATSGLLVTVVAHGDSSEANAGAAGFYLVLLILGLPWSLLLIAAGVAAGGDTTVLRRKVVVRRYRSSSRPGGLLVRAHPM